LTAVTRDARRSLILLGALLISALLAWAARRSLGLEWSAESVRETVAGFGFWGPLLFVTLVSLRFVFMIPSQILLVAAGLCFGTALGTLYGAIGITASGIGVFAVSRWIGRESILPNVPPSMRWAFDAASTRLGAAVVAVGSAYPIGPVTAVQAGAGLTRMALPVFVGAVAAGSLVRAGTYAYFGNSLAEGDWRVLLAGGLLLAVAAAPLLHPRGRAWLRARVEASTPPEAR
jgi:uncharacterized membrane protein YdjX (TVP38/TMEM64 family)